MQTDLLEVQIEKYARARKMTPEDADFLRAFAQFLRDEGLKLQAKGN